MKTLLFQIEKAWDEDILPEFISDYIGSGCGKLSDIEDAIKNSQYVSQVDYENAIKYLEMKDMLPNKVDPYKQFVEVYNAGIEYDDFELKNMLAAIYFPHMGNAVWDNAYSRILKNFESLKDERSERYNKYKQEKTEEVKRIMNEALDLDIMTVQDMLSNEIDNVSDEGLDADIKLYQFIARKLGVKDYDKLFVAVDDGNYNPEWILEDGLMVPYLDHKLYMYPSSEMIAEMHPNGNIFMYFVTEDSARKYFELADKFLNDFDVDENQFYTEAIKEEPVKVGHKRWTATTNKVEEQCTLETLEETLNKRDMNSNNEFDLLNLYLKEKFTLESRKALVEKINSGATDKELCEMLTLTESDELAKVESKTRELLSVDELPELIKVNGNVLVTDKELLDNAVDYLISNGIDYDIDSFEDEYRLTWYVGTDNTIEDVNISTARDIKVVLTEVISMLDDIIKSSDPARSAMYNDQYIKESLTEVLAVCDNFDY